MRLIAPGIPGLFSNLRKISRYILKICNYQRVNIKDQQNTKLTRQILTDKVESISKQVYNNIQYDNLFTISFEPSNVRQYINEVLGEFWKIDPDLLRAFLISN